MKKPKRVITETDRANAARNAVLRFTAAEWTLARAGWKNEVYGGNSRYKKQLSFPRGVWTHPEKGGPHSLAVALIYDKPTDGDGQPFADALTLPELRRAEAAKKQASKAAEREEIRREAADRAERIKLERSLQ